MEIQYNSLAVHSLSNGAGILRPDSDASGRVTLDGPATLVMTDFRQTSAYIATPYDAIDAAEKRMIARGVRLLLVVEPVHQDVVGLITATDILGEKPMQIVHYHGIARHEVSVADVMTPREQLEVVDFSDVARARVGHVLATLKNSGRQHALVVERNAGREMVRGVFSATRLGRQLGIQISSDGAAHTFADLEARLAHG
jgi:CBS domain containing-hemolysin-like protein